ncbi:MAG: hypothetical protein WCT31_04765 [Candidatus Micrarchaeia archaeon]|jgi:hypothetical protein
MDGGSIRVRVRNRYLNVLAKQRFADFKAINGKPMPEVEMNGGARELFTGLTETRMAPHQLFDLISYGDGEMARDKSLAAHYATLKVLEMKRWMHAFGLLNAMERGYRLVDSAHFSDETGNETRRLMRIISRALAANYANRLVNEKEIPKELLANPNSRGVYVLPLNGIAALRRVGEVEDLELLALISIGSREMETCCFRSISGIITRESIDYALANMNPEFMELFGQKLSVYSRQQIIARLETLFSLLGIEELLWQALRAQGSTSAIRIPKDSALDNLRREGLGQNVHVYQTSLLDFAFERTMVKLLVDCGLGTKMEKPSGGLLGVKADFKLTESGEAFVRTMMRMLFGKEATRMELPTHPVAMLEAPKVFEA